jgi:hypothetical protein
MLNLYLDDCSHCACITHLSRYTIEQAIRELEEGTLGCDNCMEDQGEDGDGDGHFSCVVLYDDGKVLWDGRCDVKKC